MSQISNEIDELIKQCSKLQKFLTTEDDDPYAHEAYNPKNESGLYGWICPKCGAVMSPFQSYCVKCSGNWEITYGTGTSVSPSGSVICPMPQPQIMVEVRNNE